MAIRAPSCASRKAIPRPIPLLPPVTSATRLRSDILLPGKISRKDFQYSLAAAEVLPEPRDDYRHIISLFGSSGPLLHRRHQGLCDHERRGALHTDRGFLQPANSNFFSVNIFRFNQTVTVSNQQRVGPYCQRSFLIGVIFLDAQDHAAFIQLLRSAAADQKCRKVTRICITQRSRGAVITRNEESREPVIAGVAHQMLVQSRKSPSVAKILRLNRNGRALNTAKTGRDFCTFPSFATNTESKLDTTFTGVSIQNMGSCSVRLLATIRFATLYCLPPDE